MDGFRNDTYWTSDDPQVLDAVRETRAERAAWAARTDDFVRTYHACPRMDGTRCVGVSERTDALPGQWTKPSASNPSRPFASNTEGGILLDGLSRRDVAVPDADGLADMALLDGAAYARMRDRTRRPGPSWRRCRAWEWMRAVEEEARRCG